MAVPWTTKVPTAIPPRPRAEMLTAWEISGRTALGMKLADIMPV